MNPNSQFSVPGLDALARYGVNVKNVAQVVWQPLYHYQDYAAAGASTFTFFQTPLGQNGTTLEDTNMKTAGSLPNPVKMLVTGIELFFHSGAPAVSMAGSAAPTDLQSADLNALRGRGHVQFYVGNKAVLDEIGIEQFPMGVGQMDSVAVSDTTTAGANRQQIINVARFGGRPYTLPVPVGIPSNQNFNLSVSFPNGAVAMPSGVAARIGARLLGYRYQLAQ